MNRFLANILLVTLLMANHACSKEAKTSSTSEPQAPYYLMYEEGKQKVYHQRHEEKVCRTLHGFCTVFPFEDDEIYLYLHLDQTIPLADLSQLEGTQLNYDTKAQNFVWWYAPGVVRPDSIAGNFVIAKIEELDSTGGERNRIISGTFKLERYSDNEQLHHWVNGRYRFRVYE